MPLSAFDKNVSIHQSLGNEPNIDNSLTAEELKKKFDLGAELIKAYLNERVVPAVNRRYEQGGVPMPTAPGDAVPLSYLSAHVAHSGGLLRVTGQAVPEQAGETKTWDFELPELQLGDTVLGGNGYLARVTMILERTQVLTGTGVCLTGPQGPEAATDATLTKAGVGADAKAVGEALKGKAAGSHSHTKSQITDFPASLPANGGDADTLDGQHASAFAASGHTHTGFASSSHTHTRAQITDFPASLPANGGNADTLDGYHAAHFALSGHGHTTVPGACYGSSLPASGSEGQIYYLLV